MLLYCCYLMHSLHSQSLLQPYCLSRAHNVQSLCTSWTQMLSQLKRNAWIHFILRGFFGGVDAVTTYEHLYISYVAFFYLPKFSFSYLTEMIPYQGKFWMVCKNDTWRGKCLLYGEEVKTTISLTEIYNKVLYHIRMNNQQPVSNDHQTESETKSRYLAE